MTLIVGSVDFSTFISHAEEPAYSVLGNGSNLHESNNVSFTYGTTVDLSLSGLEAGNAVSFTIIGGSISEEDTYDSGTAYGVGTYRIGYTVENSDGAPLFECDAESSEFVFTIAKTKAPTPGGLNWTSGTVAAWTGPENISCEYNASLYMEGNDTPISVKTNVTGTQVDFSGEITQSGRYTFSVTAVPTGDSANTYDTSDESEKCASFACAVDVVLNVGTGISAVSPADHFLLIVGADGRNYKEISATPASAWNFGAWTDVPEGMSLSASADQAANVLTVNAGYAGATAVSITANGNETTAPTISSFTGGEGKLTATVADNESGLFGYLFSTESNIDVIKNLPNESWTATSGNSQNVEFNLTAGGTYYVYAKDACGNVAKSGNGVAANKIEYAGYFVNNTKVTDAYDIYVGDGSFVLPDASTLKRDGYAFEGWYDNSSFTGSPITSLSSHAGLGDTATIYAKWTASALNWVSYPSATSFTYDGTNHNLTADTTYSADSVTYTWYRKNAQGDFEEISGNTGATLSVRNVEDSGTYKVTAHCRSIADDGTPAINDLAGEEFNVTITKAALTVRADAQTITYGDEAPSAYTFKYYGLKGDDGTTSGDTTPGAGAKITSAGSFTCNYAVGGNAGTYTIAKDMTTPDFASDNYNIITVESADLTVSPKDVTAASSTVSASLNETSFQYTGSAVTPVPVITDTDATITASDYSLHYYNNTHTGSETDANGPRVRIDFTGNYTGSITLHFEITRNAFTPTLTIQGYTQGSWIYGDATKTLTLSGLPSDMSDAEKANYTIYYVDGTKTQDEVNALTTGSTMQPTDAGEYTAFAIVEAAENYELTHSAPCHFEISKKTITLTAGSETWEYDGNAHSYHDFTPTKEDADNLFVKSSESFSSIETVGSITNVGTVANEIRYTLSSSTNANNYNIVCVDGQLTVTPTELPSPANCVWDDSTPGRATWVAVAKSGLFIRYKVKLIEHDDTTGTDTPLAVDGDATELVTASTYVDFGSLIHSRVDGNSNPKSYYFTVETISFGGTNQANYSDSDSNDPGTSGRLYTATIVLNKRYQNVDGYEDRYERFDLGTYGQSVTLIQGESVIVYGKVKEGYYITGLLPFDLSAVTYIDSSKISDENSVSRWRLTFTATSLTASQPSVTYGLNIMDMGPTIESFTAENKDDLSGVVLSATVYDYLGISAYRFVQLHDEGSAHYSVDPSVDASVPWIQLSNVSGSYEVSQEVNASGIWGIQVKDSGNNTYPTNFGFHSEHAIKVYKIDFNPGDGTGTMASIFKAENTAPNLPLCEFTKEHYRFKYWTGTNTGISVDGAPLVANTNDTLVAQWSNEKVNYTVNYFYMESDGTYPTSPNETAVFQGNHGDTVSVNNPTIQKPRANYSLDTSAGHNNSVELIPNGNGDSIVLNVYYNTGQYSITYTYRLPGASSDTVEQQHYYYNQTITELEKPSVVGYDFVGWEFGGSGAAPETMPADDLTATGTFRAKDTTYKVVYHLETLGTGSTKTEEFPVDENYTDILNAKNGQTITAALSGDEDTNKVVAKSFDGFTLEGVKISYGSDSGESLPADLSNATTNGTVKYSDGERLYINYYYTRNVYTLYVDVWKTNRESNGNRIFRHTEAHQYQEVLSDIDKYEDPDYYLGTGTYAGGTIPVDDSAKPFTMPTSFIFASYTDYSTGNKPSRMPAGDMTITKDVISNENAEFNIELYFETGTVGEYEKKSTLSYEYPVGANIHVVQNQQSNEGNNYYLSYSDFVQTVNNYSYYSHIVLPESSVEEGVVAGDDSLVLKVYFERKTTTATISYRYRATGENDVTIATYKVSGKWGTTYTIDPDLLFDATTADAVSSKINALGDDVTTAVSYPDNKLAYDFRNNNYLISYTGNYHYFDGNGIVQNFWPSYTFTTIGTGTNIDPGYCKQLPTTGATIAGINDTVSNYFSIDGTNHIYVNYNQISENEEFYLVPRIYTNTGNERTTLHDTSLDWYNGHKFTYPDGKTLVPVGYEYDSNSDGTKEFYQLRIINKCAIVKGIRNSAGAGLDNYPASAAKTRNYNYDDVDVNDTANLRDGCVHIIGDYYFYNPENNLNNRTTAFGEEACVYKVDPSDRFLQGAYVSYGLNEADRGDVTAFLQAYKTAHSTGGNAALDESCSALELYNTSYGGTYVQGESAYLNVTYIYRENCRLSFYFGGTTYSHQTNNSYVYGTTVPKEDVTCENIPAKDGYDVVWYTDPAKTQPIPEDGLLMNVNRTVYGQYEKSTIRNMEYIYYQLADSITLNGTTYKYVTQDNLTAATQYYQNALTCETTTEQVNVGTESAPILKTATTKKYYLEGAPVFTSIERPTQTYSELKLSKGNEDYASYYLGSTAGFYYDETNTDNRSYGYVNTTPLTLKVYFARDEYTVEVLNNRSETDNAEIKRFSVGQQVSLTSPSKDGYTFHHWEWKKWNGSAYVDYTPNIPQGEQYFDMPDLNLQAIAVYTPAEFNQTVNHFFQTEDATYLTDFVSRYQTGGTAHAVTYNDTVYNNAKIWGDASHPEAVQITTGVGIFYFNSASVSAGTITVNEGDLVAATTTGTMTSEDEILFSTLAFADSAFENYTFSYALYKDASNVVRYARDSSTHPQVKYGMKLELYYPRSANYAIALSGMSTDGGETGLTLTGAGTYYFGESVTLTAVLSDGYTFVGWYKGDDIEAGSIKTGAVPASTDPSFATNVTRTATYVAVVEPDGIIVPKVTFSGKNSYTYGYADSADNTITAIVSTTFTSADAVCSGMSDSQIAAYNVQAAKTKITGYQWYLVGQDGEGNPIDTIPTDGTTTASTYKFRTGKNAGTYTYKCKVMYERTDNGRSGELTKNYTVTVAKAAMDVEHFEYYGTYDNAPHSIRITVNSPVSPSDYEIYYHPDTEITPENKDTLTDKTQELPTYKDVKYDEINQTDSHHTTYIYIKDKTGNYTDYYGHEDVTINPKTVSIKATAQTFSKMYDGSKDVAGNATQAGTDMYAFAQGDYYTVQGYVSGDIDTQGYVLNCDATYNDEHVKHAKVFTISNMEIVNKTSGTVIHNYVFPTNATLSFTGSITPRPLDIEWVFPQETTVVAGEIVPYYVYNGTKQGPGIQVSQNQTYPIPTVDADIVNTLSVSNKQDNVGTYEAAAYVTVPTGAHYESSDYSFSVTNQTYVIGKREVTVTPTAKTVTYNGAAQTITEYTTEGLVASHSSTAASVKSYVDAGIYDDMSMKNLVITDSVGRVKNDNYDITYAPGTLTINKCPVKVEGITIPDKEYDGTTAVTSVDVSGASFTPMIPDGSTQLFVNALTGERDTLALDASTITAVFADSHVTGGGTVNLTLTDGTLINASGKDCLKNYTLDIVHSQKTATAGITATTVRVKAKPFSVVYGEDVSFDSTLSGFYENGEFKTYDYADVKTQITGKPTYLIKVGDSWVSYVPGTIPVGTYEIKVDTSSMSSADYTFAWEEDAAYSILTVTQRPVSIASSANPNVAKDYDGTTTVSAGLVTKAEDYVFGTKAGSGATAKGVLPSDESGLDLSSFDAVYNSKDVAAANKVTLTNLVLNNTNYVLTDAEGNAITSLDIAASIQKLDLELSLSEKTITYGAAEINEYAYTNASDKYRLTLTGFLDGEDTSVLTGDFTISDTYDITDPTKRKVGDYDVTVAINNSFDADNYVIKKGGAEVTVTNPAVFNNALHVEKKTLSVTANDKVMKYKVGVEGNPGHVPNFNWTYSGFVEEWDNATSLESGLSVLSSYVTEKDSDTVITPALDTVVGEYDIKLSGDPSLDNYRVEKHTGVFEVIPSEITVSTTINLNELITIAPKVYDGTTALVDGQITMSASQREALIADLANPLKGAAKCLLEADKQYLLNHPNEPILVFDYSGSTYADKNVGTGKAVTVEYTLAPYLANRYVLEDDTNKSATADITAASLTITPADKEIFYGDAKPTSFTYTARGLKNNETIESTADFTGSLSYSVDDYVATAGFYSSVNTSPGYEISVSGVSNNNYVITYNPGHLIVKQAKLVANTPVWSETNPGRVSWPASTSIGNVTVAGYELQLVKGSTVVETVTVNADVLTHDFTDKMHEAAGAYKVKVKAIPSTDNNAAKANVADSDVVTTASSRKVISVSAAFGTQSDGKASDKTIDTESGDPIWISFASDGNATPHRSVNAIEGENLIFKAEVTNGTGYTPAVTVSGSDVSVSGTPTFASEGSIYAYSGALSVAGSIPDATVATNVTVNLAKTAARCAASITAVNTNAYYGFVESEAPMVTATPQAVSGDNVDLSGYDFTYTWEIKDTKNTQFSASDYNTKVTNSTDNTYHLPALNDDSKKLETGGNRYWIRCKVTATRKDNGESTVLTTNQVKLSVQKGTYSPLARFNNSGAQLTSGEWRYGETRLPLEVINATLLREDIPAGENFNDYVVWQYSTTGAEATFSDYNPTTDQTIYTDVGTYYVRAKMRASTNYPETYTPAIPYTITRAKLATPTGLSMTASPTAPYGLAVWNQVSGPVENANAGGISASHISVKYQVELKRADIGRPASEAILVPGGSVIVADSATPSYDFTDLITEAGTYYLSVKALVDGTTLDQSNCEDSDLAEYTAMITIGAEIKSNLSDIHSFEKEYDGQPLVMTAVYENTTQTYSYQWMKNGQPISGATSANYPITYVEENAKYACKITVNDGNGTVYYTKVADAKIRPRKIVLSSPSESWVYDAASHAKNDTSLITAVLHGNSTYTGDAFATGDNLDSVSLSETITDVSQKANTISGVVIKRGSKVVFDATGTQITSANNNYAVTYNNGTLTVTKRPITVTAASDSKTYDATALTNAGFTVTDGVTGANILATGHTVEATVTGTRTTFGEATNTVGDVLIKDVTVDKTANYEITKVSGTLSVSKKTLTITGADDSKTYDGTPLTFVTADTLPTQGFSVSGLTGGDALSALTISGTITNFGSVNNTPSAATVENASGDDVTASYNITYVPGTLTVTKRAVTLKADDKFSTAGSAYGSAIKPLTVSVVSGSNATLSADAIISELSAHGVTSLNNHSAVGVYNDAISVVVTDTHNNYDVTLQTGHYEVTKATLTVNATNYTGVYDGAAHGISVTPQAIFAGETPTVYYATETLNDANYLTKGSTTAPTFTEVCYSGSSVADYTVYYYVAMDNYAGYAGSETVRINPRTITFTSGSASKVYDGTALVKNSYTYTPSGANVSLVSGDHVSSIVIAGTITNFGTAENTVSNARIEDANDFDVTENYDISYVYGNLQITKRPITVKAADAQKVYDGTALTTSDVSVTSGSLATGDSITAAVMTDESTITDVAYAGSAVTTVPNVIKEVSGVPQVTIKDAHGTDVSNCYNITTANGALKVTKKDLTVTANDFSKVYDGTAFTKAGTYTSDAPTQENRVNAVVSSVTGLVSGDALYSVALSGSITYYGTFGSATNTIGSAVVKKGTVDKTGNYNISYVNGTLSITKRPITVTAASATGANAFVYDGTYHTVSTGYTVSSGSLAGSDVLTATMTSDSKQKDVGVGENKVGNVTVKTSGGADVTSSYEITKTSGSIEVKKRAVTLKPDDATGYYGSVPTNLPWRVEAGSIAVPGEIQVTVNTTTDANSDVGVHSNALSISAANSNYEITTMTADYIVVKRPISIVAGSKQAVFHEGDVLTYNAWNLASGSSLAPNDSVDSIDIDGQLDALGEADNVASNAVIKRGGIDVTGNYEITYVNGTLKFVQPAPIIPTGSESAKPASAEETPEIIKNVLPYVITPESGDTVSTNVPAKPSSKQNNTSREVKSENVEGAAEGIAPSVQIIGTGKEARFDAAALMECSVTEADTNRMIKELLSDKEKDSYEKGGSVIFRVELDEKSENEKSIENIVKKNYVDSEIAGIFETVFFVRINEETERRIDKEYSSVKVAVKLSEEMITILTNGGELIRVYRDENGVLCAESVAYEVVDDNVIMQTDNFSTYMVLDRRDDCIIHWIVLLLLLLSVVIVLVWFSTRNKKDEKKRNKGYTAQLIVIVILNVAGGALVFYFGECKWDIVAEIALILSSALIEGTGGYITKKKKS